MKKKLSLRTPAKINLALRILGKRDDGYHEIETILQMIGIYDFLDFEPSSSGVEFYCNTPSIPRGETNLVIKAARVLQKSFPKQTCSGVRINLKKTIPSGAGLGGGSGNAAGTLLGLNYFWDLKLKRENLIPLAANLGSDVPFFLVAPYAFGSGRGEKLIPLQPIQKISIVLIYPEILIPTFWAYEQLNLKLTKKENNISILQKFLSLSDISRLGSLLQNDMEPLVFKAYPEISKVKNRLRGSGADGVLMSGTGSAIFGFFIDRQKAENAFSNLKQEFREIFLAQTIHTFSEFFPEKVLGYP